MLDATLRLGLSAVIGQERELKDYVELVEGLSWVRVSRGRLPV
jgi:hypothetical protein